MPLEIITLMLAFWNAAVDIRVAGIRKTLRKPSLLWVHFAAYLSVVLCGVLRPFSYTTAVQAQVQAQGVAVVLSWMGLSHHFQYLPRIGPFFLTIQKIAGRDLSKFAAILGSLLPGYAICFSLFHSALPLFEDPNGQHLSPFASAFSLFTMMGGMGTWCVPQACFSVWLWPF